jgi:hypothetical protein
MNGISYHGWKSILVKSIPLLFLLVCSFNTRQGNPPIDEYNLKAAFIYNFTKYIEWNPLDKGEFTIGVIGSSPINDALSGIARSKTVNGRRITIRQFNKPVDIDSCQILFISKNNPAPLTEILAETPKGTLTVSEKQGYAVQGTAINFITANDKLKFEVNQKAINKAGLTASSQLLKLAVIVE